MDLILVLAILIVPIMAEIMIIKNYNKCNNIINENNVSGMEVAHKILENNKLDNIYVVEIPEKLKDHYDINRKVVRLSKSVFNDNTLFSLSMSSLQCAHAILDKDNNTLFKARENIHPIAKLLTIFAYILIIVGAFSNNTNTLYIGISIIGVTLAFELLTLPVELKAQKIAFTELKKAKYLEKKEEDVIYRLLRVIGFIYVASILTCISDLVKYIMSLINDKK